MASSDTVLVSLPNDWKRISVPCASNATGQSLFKLVMAALRIEEPVWFSIEVLTRKGKKHWLQAGKTLEEQDLDLKRHVKLRVKYFPPTSTIILQKNSAVTRNLLYLDIQENVLNGNIACPTVQALQLAAFTMQAVFGDFNPAVHVAGFLDENKEKNRANLLPRVLPDIIMKKSPEVTSAEWHRKIFELHQRLAGWSVAKAEAGYVTVAQQLPQYGVSFHEILDTSNVNRMIGISLKGIHFYESSTEQPADVSFSWSELDSTYVQGSKFAIQLKDTVMPLITVRMKSKSDATELLDMCIGYHMRFNRVMEQQRIAIAQRSGNAPTPTKSGTSPNPATAAPAPAAAPAASSSAAPAADTAPIAYDETVINQEEKAEAQLQKTVLSKNDGKGTVRIKVGANLFAVSESQDDAEDLPAGLSQARKALDEEPPAGTKDPFMNTLKRVRNAAKDAENTFLMFAKMIEQNPDSVSDIDIDKLLGGAR